MCSNVLYHKLYMFLLDCIKLRTRVYKIVINGLISCNDLAKVHGNIPENIFACILGYISDRSSGL